jgi:trehalose/maltose hydrolase-like predicted phosphorylase
LKAHFPKRFEELTEQLTLESGELKNWQSMIDQVFIPSDPETGLIEQFDGYFNRREVNLGKYEDRVISMQALFGIEEINLTKVLKQPDVLMLLYLHPEAFDDQTVRSNYAYYTPRTDHTYGSSLGPTIQSIMACRVGKLEEAYEHFMRAACADLFDIRGNSKDGIHGASAGGLWQAVVFGFAGLQVNSAGWSLHPNLPPGWKRVMFKFCYHGKLQEVEVKNQDDPKSLHL